MCSPHQTLKNIREAYFRRYHETYNELGGGVSPPSPGFFPNKRQIGPICATLRIDEIMILSSMRSWFHATGRTASREAYSLEYVQRHLFGLLLLDVL
jgi:hypothetical protein